MKNLNSQSQSQNLSFKKYKPILWWASFIIFISLIISFFFSSSSVFHYIFQGGLGIKNTNGVTNVLLLGNAGGTHDGPYLTDTIMVASINLRKSNVNLISLPRDLWIDDLKMKINAVYEVGKAKGQGVNFSKEKVGDILGIPIHFGVRIDFRGFVQAIDQVGGVDLIIDKSFSDSLYPIVGRENDLCGMKEEEKDLTEGGKQKVILKPDGNIATESADFPCRFETISFNVGQTHLDGETALKFIRSRMGTNNEGSDFARSKRQQKVLEAFRGKVLSAETLINPGQIKKLLTTFGESVETDIPIDDAIVLYSFVKKTERVQNFVIDGQKENSLLINPPIGNYGGWVLVPKSGNYNDIQLFVQKILKGEIINESSASARSSN